MPSSAVNPPTRRRSCAPRAAATATSTAGCWRVPAAAPPLALPAPPMPANVLHGQLHREEETPEVRLPGVDGDESDNNSDGSEYYDERSMSPPSPPHLPAPVVHQPYYPSTQHMLLSLGSSWQAQRLPL